MKIIKTIDSSTIQSHFNIFDDRPFKCLSGILKDKNLFVTADGKWSCKSPDQFFGPWKRGDLTLSKDGRTYLLEKPMFEYCSEEGFGGSSIGLLFKSAEIESTKTYLVQRIATLRPKQLQNIVFPDWLRDSADGREFSELLQLDTDFGKIDIYYANTGMRLVVECVLPGSKKDDFHSITGGVLLLLGYFFGVSLDTDGGEIVTSTEGRELILSRIFPGRNHTDSGYAPIPSHHQNWIAAKEQLKIEKSIRALEPSILAPPINKYLNEPQLVHVFEYLMFFPSAPVEMRGAILSIALESLTSCLVKKGLLAFTNPVEDEKWPRLQESLFQHLLKELPADTPEETKELFKAKIKNLNSPSNRDKLTKPFRVLNVELTPDEWKALKARNPLLHRGRYFSDEQLEQADEDAWKEPYKMEMCLYTAINKLLLKYLGYTGPISDWGAKDPHSAKLTFTRI